jgi:hypothetical protein
MIIRSFVGREASIRSVEGLGENRLIFLASQKDVNEADPTPESISAVEPSRDDHEVKLSRWPRKITYPQVFQSSRKKLREDLTKL